MPNAKEGSVVETKVLVVGRESWDRQAFVCPSNTCPRQSFIFLMLGVCLEFFSHDKTGVMGYQEKDHRDKGPF